MRHGFDLGRENIERYLAESRMRQSEKDHVTGTMCVSNVVVGSFATFMHAWEWGVVSAALLSERGERCLDLMTR